MLRLTNSVLKYRKHRPSGQAVVTIAGRTHYLGPHGTKASRLEYDRLIAEWLAAGRSVSFGTPSQELTVSELLASYLVYAKRYYPSGPSSEYGNMARAAKPLRRLYGKTAAADFGPVEYKAVRHTLLQDDCSRSYVNTTMRRIVRIFRWSVAEAGIPATVPQTLAMVPGIKKGRTDARETDPVKPILEEAVQTTLPHLSETVSDMVMLQRLTGCRPAEVCLVRPMDVDMSGDVWKYQPESHKTKHLDRERIVFLGPKAQCVLRPYLLRAAEAHCFSPVDAERKRREAMTTARKMPLSYGNTVGSNRKRKPRRTPRERYDTHSYRRAIHRACDRAGIDRWSPNRLRHSAATEIRREYGLEGSQVVLGHSHAAVSEIYAERDATLAIRIAREVG